MSMIWPSVNQLVSCFNIAVKISFHNDPTCKAFVKNLVILHRKPWSFLNKTLLITLK